MAPTVRPCDDAALTGQDQQRDRNRRHDGCRQHLAPWHLIAAAEQHDRDRNRVAFGTEREREREEKLVPAVEKRQDRRARDPGRGQRQHHVAQRPHPRRAVQHRRLFEIARQLAEESRQQPDGERHREGQVRKHQPGIRVQISRSSRRIRYSGGTIEICGNIETASTNASSRPLPRHSQPRQRVRAQRRRPARPRSSSARRRPASCGSGTRKSRSSKSAR